MLTIRQGNGKRQRHPLSPERPSGKHTRRHRRQRQTAGSKRLLCLRAATTTKRTAPTGRQPFQIQREGAAKRRQPRFPRLRDPPIRHPIGKVVQCRPALRKIL